MLVSVDHAAIPDRVDARGLCSHRRPCQCANVRGPAVTGGQVDIRSLRLAAAGRLVWVPGPAALRPYPWPMLTLLLPEPVRMLLVYAPTDGRVGVGGLC